MLFSRPLAVPEPLFISLTRKAAFQAGWLRHFLFYFPNVICFKEFCKVVVLLGGLDFFNLSGYCIVICGSLDVADNAQSYGESVAVTHQGQLELQGVVLAVGIVYKDILQCDAVLTNLYNLKAESLLNQSELIVLTEYQGLTVLNVDGVLGAALLIIYCIVSTVIEDDAVLQDLADRCTLVVVSGLEDIHCAGSIGGNGAGKEVTACAKAELCGTERILNSSVGA